MKKINETKHLDAAVGSVDREPDSISEKAGEGFKCFGEPQI